MVMVFVVNSLYQKREVIAHFFANSLKLRLLIRKSGSRLDTTKAYQEYNNMKCKVTVDGYTDFIFINRFGNLQHQGTLNKALRRIIRDCNDMQLSKGKKNPVLLPKFSCHSLRHTFTTRLVEAGVNIKVIQELCGHSSSDVTLDIYTTVTKELKQREFGNFEERMKQQKKEWEQALDIDHETENEGE